MFSIGIITELTERQIVWLLVCLGLISYLHRRLKIDMRPFHWIRLPQIVIVFFILTFIIIDQKLSGGVALDFVGVNWLFLVLGIIILVTVYLYQLYKRKRASKQPVSLNECTVQPKTYLEQKRFSKGYVLFLVTLVLIVSNAPATIISHSTNGYLLQRQADLQRLHAKQKSEERKSKLTK